MTEQNDRFNSQDAVNEAEILLSQDNGTPIFSLLESSKRFYSVIDELMEAGDPNARNDAQLIRKMLDEGSVGLILDRQFDKYSNAEDRISISLVSIGEKMIPVFVIPYDLSIEHAARELLAPLSFSNEIISSSIETTHELVRDAIERMAFALKARDMASS